MNNETNFSEQQSLNLITAMIEQARNNVQKGAANSMILNGYAVAAIALLNIALAFIFLGTNQIYWIWCLMIPVWVVNRLLDKKQEKQAVVKTHIDKIVNTTWNSFGFAVAIFLLLIFGYGIAMKNPKIFIMITPMIMLMAGLAEFVTAKACRFKPFFVGACVMWAGALACLAIYIFLHYWAGIAHFFILAVCMVMSFSVPGHKLNKMAKNNA